jgi:hypothetical protein
MQEQSKKSTQQSRMQARKKHKNQVEIVGLVI